MARRKYICTLNLKNPWGLNPLFFGTIQFIWAILVLIVYLSCAINGNGNFEITIVIALIPTFSLLGFEAYRSFKLGWLLRAISSAASTNQMIVYSKPPYRTIFGYMKREIAPSFDIYQMSDGSYEVKPNANGCPHFDTDFMNALLKELPGYIVYVKRGFPWIIGIEDKKKGGKHLQDANFL
ncbi:hypothetical protein LHEJCM1005_10940 [Lactobacillus helveticus]|uniref:hypothetical protein n=1 Tax=Lactobacillus helveticus TaxID=1587 RepID=UPI00191B9F53|nr:hypothetical protein [Lactobacillus helveticus]GFP06802.1 hypothetical protein LHEJCM1005_10940 [Lactobacillus helveticus]